MSQSGKAYVVEKVKEIFAEDRLEDMKKDLAIQKAIDLVRDAAVEE